VPDSARSEFLPGRRLPLAYLGFAHACLALALGVLVFAPQRVAGFYYQPRMFGIVHLVTLGSISGSILGALYLVAPLAFRLALPVVRLDWVAFASFAIGTLGMASHFWIDRPIGMLWAAPLPFFALAYVGGRLLRGLRRAPVPAEAKLHVGLACVNVLLAGSLGFLFGLNKVRPLVGVPPFAGVGAHAHLAAVGWALMMVMGTGYRLLPMFLPSEMPRGRWLWATASVTELGVVGFVLHTLARGEASPLFATTIAAGIVLFLSRVAWMLAHRKPPPKTFLRPDWGMAHAASALVCLLLSIGLGLLLSWSEPSERTLQLGKVYGLLGLLGFLAQMTVGIESRLLPMTAWLWSFAEGGYADQPGSQYEMPVRSLQAAGFVAWTLGLPALAYGLYADASGWTSAGATALLFATLGSAANGCIVLRRSRRRAPPPPKPSYRGPA
jgi:hypothetical protein